jgi:hypothetical protein
MARNHPTVTEAWGVEWSGRLHLMDDLRASDRLRAIGIFLRDQAAVDARILSPWPGAIGYLSRRRVVDLLGRVEPTAGRPAQSWRGRTRADLVEVLSERPEYVVPVVADLRRPPTLDELVASWLERYDVAPPTAERRAALVQALAPYELVAVPVPEREQELTLPSASPGYLLRLRELGLGPHLELVTEGAWIEVIVEHPGHHQIAELEVRVDGPDGRRLYLRPSGTYATTQALVRTETLLFPTGDRRVELVRAQLPVALLEDGLPPAGLTVTARLLNPFSDPGDPLSPACAPVTHSY